jgi:hypothetical protein
MALFLGKLQEAAMQFSLPDLFTEGLWLPCIASTAHVSVALF